MKHQENAETQGRRPSSGPAVGSPTLSLPEGGSISGFGEVFEPHQQTGAGGFRFPIPLPDARGISLDLVLAYASSSGNGPFGVGFAVSTPSIQRRTDKGVPRYDDTDQFILDGEILVPRYLPDGNGGWMPAQRGETSGGAEYLVTSYLPRVVLDFDLIEHWLDAQTGRSHWRLVDSDNIETLFGVDDQARIVDPSHPRREFAWLAQSTRDALGNRIEYSYLPEDGQNIPATLGNAGRDHQAGRYLSAVRYGNYVDAAGVERFGFQVLFDYGNYDLSRLTPADPAVAPNQSWPTRPDPFSTYRAGFEIRSYRRCRAVLVTHDFPDQLGAGPTLAAAVRLEYDENPAGSRICSIQQIGYRLDQVVAYAQRAMPQLKLQYSEFTPSDAAWGELTVPGGDEFPGLLSDGLYRLIDLYGDGLPGVLYANENLFLYWRPMGKGRYANPQKLPEAPSEMRLQRRAFSLQDLIGGGRLDLVVGASNRGGFYRNRQDGTWEPFRSFDSYTPEYTDPDAALVDLDGNGLADLYTPADQTVRYFPGLGESGFAAPLSRPTAVAVPTADAQFATRLIRFLDLFGDGLACRMELRGGSVTAWPNLGHGRFDEPIVFAGAPVLPASIRMDRVLFGDVTGNGFVDLLLVFDDGVELYPNLSGNRFGEAIRFPAPFGVNERDQVFLADVFGNGGSVLVVSRPGDPVRHYYLDFAGGVRPGLLTGIDNGAGSRTEVRYRSSTDYVMQDRARGIEWTVRPPNPVQVVSQIRRGDQVGGGHPTRVFQYRDGYYDPVERRFLGFGMLQSQDSETFDQDLWLFPTVESPPQALLSQNDFPPLVQPSLTRMWSMIGVYSQWPELSASYEKEYWDGDPEAISIPPFVYDPQIAQGDSSTQSEAQVALSGRIVRHESFAVEEDGKPRSAPASVRENGLYVRLLQPRISGRNAVFQVIERQRAESHYDSAPDDPRIQHRVALAWDELGNVTRTAHVSYPRRSVPAGSPPRQGTLQAYAELSDYINATGSFHRSGLEYQSRTLELSGLSPVSGRYYEVGDLQAQVEQALADTLPYGTLFTPGQRQARVQQWHRAFFSDPATGDSLPLGVTSAQGLLYNVPVAVFSDSLVQSIYDPAVVTPTLLGQEGGFQHRDGYWWNPGETAFYRDGSDYFLLASATDPFGNATHYGYDPAKLVATSITDALGQTESAELDYQAFQVRRLTDVNGIVSEVAYDPLGMVIVSTTHKDDGTGPIGNLPLSDYVPQPPASIDQVLQNPETYLQGASAFFAYDLDSWGADETPLSSVSLQRVDWYYLNGQPAPPSRIRRQAAYVDGLGRIISKKNAVDSQAIDPSETVAAAPGGIQDPGLLWITTGRAVFNDRGEAVRSYTPYSAATAAFDADPPSGFTRYSYDSLGRLIRTDTPKGFFSKTVYSPWSTVEYDENDTVEDSIYYNQHIGDPDPAFARERAALEQAARDQNTPSTSHLNPRGQVIQLTRINVEDGGDPPPQYEMVTQIWLDLQGNQLASADPRFYNPANPGQPIHYNFENTYSMQGLPLLSVNADSGTVTDLRAADDLIIERWDALGRRLSTLYDALRRETGTKVRNGPTADRFIQRLSYGDDPSQLNLNLPVQQYDDAGSTATPLYDLGGNALQAEVRFRQDYDAPPDWNDPTSVPMMPDLWIRTWKYNAAGEVQSETNADGSVTVYRTYLNGWLQTLGLVSSGGGPEEPIVANLTYNALSGRREMLQGGTIASTFTYDDKNYRLIGIRSQRLSDQKVLQDYSYVYDPIGNLISAADGAQPVAFSSNQQINPQRDYVYDAVYRLLSASGRQSVPGGTLENYTRNYSYDLSGNLSQLRAIAASGGFTQDFATSSSSNRSVPQSWVVGGQDPDSFFDDAGSLGTLERSAPDPSLPALTYNDLNQLSSCLIVPRQAGDADAAYFDYFWDGMRGRKVLRRNTGSGLREENTYYVGDLAIARSSLQGQSASSEVLSLRLKAGDEMVLVRRAERAIPGGTESNRTDRYQLQNIIGSICIEVDPAGSIISFEEYYPYGGSAILDGSAAEVQIKRYRFSGKELDKTTGLYYFGHRFYSPYLLRWLNPDPAGPVDGLNLYSYARNNPTTFVDPTGLCPIKPDPRAYHMTLVDEQYRYLTPQEYQANYDLSFDIQHEIKMKNSLLFSDENQRFSQATEDAIVERFGEFSGLFMTANPLMGQIWSTANSRLANPSTGLDFRHDYSLTRSHMNKVIAEMTPEFDFSTGLKAFETHHLLLKSLHPELAVTTQNMVLATRGSLSSGYVGLHEGLFHMLTAGQMGGLYSTEVAGVAGLIKRLIGKSQGVDLTDSSQLASAGFGWLELENRSKGAVVKVWSASDTAKKKAQAQARVTQYTSGFGGSAVGIISSSHQATLAAQSQHFLSSGGSTLSAMDID